jgi:flagellar biosynthesis protein FlhF
MRLRTFSAATMNDAMQLIRSSVGDDAVIISSGPDPLGRGVNITVATDDILPQPIPNIAKPQPFVPLAARSMPTRISRESVLKEVEKILEFHGTPNYLAAKLLQTAQFVPYDPAPEKNNIHLLLKTALEATFRFSPLTLESLGYRLMLIGPPGIGKTLAIAKMASRLTMSKLPVTVITTDNMRAGGVEQLAAFTAILGIPLEIAGTKAELRKILQSAPPQGRVLIDSAGMNPYNPEEMQELIGLAKLEGVEPVLAAVAGIDSRETEDITQAFLATGVRRLLITRADTARRIGNILTAANLGNLAFCNVSSTSRVVGKFAPLDADALTQLLMQHLTS